MKVSILCTAVGHPVFPRLEQWAARTRETHEVTLESSLDRITDGDILFLVSVDRLVPREIRDRFRATLVLHASALPEGRGWSPHIWQVLEGRSMLTVSLLAADDRVDAGPIWAQSSFTLRGDELLDEINEALFSVEFQLMNHAIDNFESIRPRPQSGDAGSYYRRRTAADSRVDPFKSLAEQFELLRVVDPDRYPAFFDYRGCRYKLVISKMT